MGGDAENYITQQKSACRQRAGFVNPLEISVCYHIFPRLSYSWLLFGLLGFSIAKIADTHIVLFALTIILIGLCIQRTTKIQWRDFWKLLQANPDPYPAYPGAMSSRCAFFWARPF
jgi:hypothetical protein